MLTLRFALWWTTLLAVVVAANTVVIAVMNGVTVQEEVDHLNWAFLSGVALGPIGLMAVGQVTVTLAAFATKKMGSAKREAKAKAAAWKSFVDGVGR